jgi:XXXCH domain-containing protein
MGSHKEKLEREVPVETLRGLLDCLGVELADCRSLELTLKPRDGAVRCRARVKLAAAEEPEKGGRPKYSQLKKRMKADWKEIRRSLGAGTLPEASVVERFLADSRLMCTYPGKGDPLYPAYLEAVASLSRAMASGSLEAVIAACAEVNGQRRECHRRYD